MAEEPHDTEKEEEDVFVEKRLDMDRLVNDFAEYLGKPEGEMKSKGDRAATNLFHMFMTLATAGAYWFVYAGYQLYKFFQRNPVSKYKVEVEVKPKTDEEDEEQE